MKDHAGHIRNPLTVISIFAAIAEISGTTTLPFIAPENQATYIWFLMLFPALLVIAFFLTLNFNHKTLYAPSDYQNQNHFLSLFGIVTPDERDEKLNDELIEAISDKASNTDGESGEQQSLEEEAPEITLPQDPPSSTISIKEDEIPYVVSPPKTLQQLEMSVDPETSKEHEESFNFEKFAKKIKLESKIKLREVEKASIEQVGKLTNIVFSKKVKFDIPNLDQPLIFDAIADQNDAVHIVEIKYFDNTPFSVSRFHSTLANANIAALNVYRVSNRKVVVHLVAVFNPPSTRSSAHNISIALKNAAKPYDYAVKVYVFNEEDLVMDHQLKPWTFRPDTRQP